MLSSTVVMDPYPCPERATNVTAWAATVVVYVAFSFDTSFAGIAYPVKLPLPPPMAVGRDLNASASTERF